ncbi:MAG: ATP-binding cassette domain-containing protein [Ignavibacteria bacterium]|nr:ATP-binding cassette domain-containing protein [Ignavibacteria bacterium]MBT8381864.1 ATP-binding cassette domain-containing protein [Ignavibacteria bacterium]MBT8393200.1 ATP-binding cassette domain-containing protein [Ignavibacteria bacterium]NNJ52386.1 ATP-binding cassette domain-containing protein [Ignavibacteriaceae bacterium]NNL21828.1 ATP-binding cassette domain-containing protein [Ignavibacteriaceae bacterium]
MDIIIQISNLKKSYNEIEAVKQLNLDINEGEMFGLVGPDGAGKTTTIRILCGLLKTDSGSVKVFGLDLNKKKNEIQDQIGYLSQKFSLYGDLSIDENIEFFADIHNVKNFKARRDELLQFTRLTPFRDRLADKLSGGMRQKLALACSLIHKPKIIFLDEPTTGVDPVSRRDFWKILSDLQKDGITILMTTPYLDEAERCNRVALMNNGEIIAVDTPQNIKSSINKSVIEIICDDIKKAYLILKEKYIDDVQIFGDRINIITDSAQKTMVEIKLTLNRNNLELQSHRIITPSLENVFIHLVKKAS